MDDLINGAGTMENHLAKNKIGLLPPQKSQI